LFIVAVSETFWDVSRGHSMWVPVSLCQLSANPPLEVFFSGSHVDVQVAEDQVPFNIVKIPNGS
jgi:hypothetical protein